MKGIMLNNYWGQLIQAYPQKTEILEWMKNVLDNRVYYYGQHFSNPFKQPLKKSYVRSKLAGVYRKYKFPKESYEGVAICNAYFNVSENIRREGLKVTLPPWETYNLSENGNMTWYQMQYADFNIVLSEDFERQVYSLKDELMMFFKKNHTPFLLLSNDILPIHRMAIDVCKELGIPTGIFLHGLPARYNAIDDSRADYLFVWGEKIKTNYINAGSKTNIVVVGHPDFSSFNIEECHPNDVVVLSRAVQGAPSDSSVHVVDDRGICLQHIFAIEKALKEVGVDHAILRLHPSENPDWYAKYMDKEFYTLDKNTLNYTIGHAKMVIGQISTVMLNTVINGIPCYPYVIDRNSNQFASKIAPPFCDKPEFPTATTTAELVHNIKTRNCVTKDHFEGYINPSFDIKKLISSLV